LLIYACFYINDEYSVNKINRIISIHEDENICNFNCFVYSNIRNRNSKNDYLNNFNIIKYLIEDYKININHLDNNLRNCLIYTCWFNPNINTVRYLIEECKMDINIRDCKNCNCILYSSCNSNINIIKYLIKRYQIDLKNKYNKCLLFTCYFNQNIDMIKYFN